jgi:hypothetical protein
LHLQTQIALICGLLVPTASAQPAALLFADDFANLDNWRAELESPGAIQVHNGVLTLDVPAGCTLWFKHQLEGPIDIEYEAKMIQTGGPHDRVSDLNSFWMATDSRSPADLFATRRSGKFSDYDQLRTYYVGQGGNANSTTRFRRYIGRQDLRPLLPAHDLRDPQFLLQPNVAQTIRLVANGNQIQYLRDGKLIFDFHDPAPYARGYFAFRTTQSHIELRRFRVTRHAIQSLSK